MTKIMNLPEFRSFCENCGMKRFYYNSSNDCADDAFNISVSFPSPTVVPAAKSVCFSEGKSNRMLLGNISRVVYTETEAGIRRVAFERAGSAGISRFTFHVL